MPPARTGYSATQIALHWIIAVLIVAQVVAHGGMKAVYGAAQDGKRGDGRWRKRPGTPACYEAV